MIIASCATIYERRDMLKESIDSLKSQVDLVVVNCGYDDCLSDFENVVFRPHNEKQPSEAKFRLGSIIENASWHFTFDDDIHYPANYVAKHLETHSKFENPIISCVHGSVFLKSPMENYFSDRRLIRLQKKSKQTTCHSCGTGTICYSPSAIRFLRSDFDHNNMDDLYVSKKASKHGIPVIAVARPARWLRINRNNKKTPRICSSARRRTKKLTSLANEILENSFLEI